MTKTDTGPEQEVPAAQGSLLRGFLGSLLGAFLGALLWNLLLVFVPDELGKLAILGGILVGWMACWGYRLLQGRRSLRAGRWTVRLCVVLSQPLALAVAFTLVDLWRRHGTLWVHVDALAISFRRVMAFLLEPDTLPLLGILILFSLFFCSLSCGVLLKYADPGWYSDPRRQAQVGGGGAMFNAPPCWPLPKAGHIPVEFSVDRGKLTVCGDTITVNPRGKGSRSFSVSEVAGVVLGPSSGYNILYDRNDRTLAQFAWSRKNALLFGQYLLQRGTPFFSLGGEPLPLETEGTTPRQFTVRERKFCLVLGWGGILLFGGVFAVALAVFPLKEALVTGGTLLLLGPIFGALLLCYYNRRLEVDGEWLTYTTALRRTTRFHFSDAADVTWSLNGCKIKDREGRTLARFENNMENAELLMFRWNEYRRERTE